MAADTYVRARIDTNTKERAADALEAMGLSISDQMRGKPRRSGRGRIARMP